MVKILLVEDSQDDAKLVELELRKLSVRVEMVRVDDEPAMREILAGQAIDLVISDWSLPGFSGARALEVAGELAPHLPFIIVSGDMGEEAAVSAMRAGANDFVLKDKLKRLVPAIERELRDAKVRFARQAAEEKLRLQDLRFRALLEHSCDVITLKTADSHFLYISPAVERLLGYGSEDLVGKSCLEMVSPDDRARVAVFNAALLATEQSRVIEYRVLHRDGSTRWLEVTETNRLADPAVNGVVGNVRDITERKHAHERLAASELKYRRIIETTHEGVLVVDKHARIAFANGQMTSIVGRTPEELLGMPLVEIVEAAFREETLERHGHRLEGVSGFGTNTFLHADGSHRQVVVEATPILDEAGQVESVLVMVSDITARRAAEAALRASENRFARLAETAVIGIAIVAFDGQIQDANDTLLRVCGYERRELLSTTFSWLDLQPPENRQSALDRVGRLRDVGSVEPFERELVRKDGSRVWTLLGAAVLDQHKGIMFVVDISAQKAAEAALALTEQQLRHAQKMEAMGRLAGGVAHDFNNVLSVILSYAEILIEDVRVDAIREDLVEIRKAAERAAQLTEQLLLFGRKRAATATLEDPIAAVRDLERMLRRLLGEDVALEITPTGRVPKVRIDKGQLDQVIINLAINARDAMPRGGKLTIALSWAGLDDEFTASHHGVTPGDYACIVVTDTGTGMDAETVVRIFEPFFTTKEIGKGTGLGLSTVFGIVQRAGGSIWVESELGTGTSFTIYLPRSTDHTTPIAALPVTGGRGGTETVLLVEDDPQVRMVAAGILKRAGYQVLSADSPADAIRIAHQHPKAIDLLVADVVMPQMSGIELSHQITQIRPRIAVLLMSGYTDETTERHGVGAEAHFLQKPLTPDALRSKARQALASRGIARPA